MATGCTRATHGASALSGERDKRIDAPTFGWGTPGTCVPQWPDARRSRGVVRGPRGSARARRTGSWLSAEASPLIHPAPSAASQDPRAYQLEVVSAEPPWALVLDDGQPPSACTLGDRRLRHPINSAAVTARLTLGINARRAAGTPHRTHTPSSGPRRPNSASAALADLCGGSRNAVTCRRLRANPAVQLAVRERLPR
jgi:hypothetical protein